MMKRRNFIKIATFSAFLATTGITSFSISARAAAISAKDKLVDVKNAMAAALKYNPDATAANTRGLDKADQFCSGCALYTGKDGEAQGPCLLFASSAPKQEVKAEGWCVSWSKKG
jgi:hypothetical protein